MSPARWPIPVAVSVVAGIAFFTGSAAYGDDMKTMRLGDVFVDFQQVNSSFNAVAIPYNEPIKGPFLVPLSDYIDRVLKPGIILYDRTGNQLTIARPGP